jgi:hypothetical protein
VVVGNEKGIRGARKMSNARVLAPIVVIDVLFSEFAAILE